MITNKCRNSLLGCILLFTVMMANGQGINNAHFSSSSNKNDSQDQEKSLVDTSKDSSKAAGNGSASSISNSGEKQERSLIISNGLSRGYARQRVDSQVDLKSINLASRNVPEVEDIFNRNKGAIYSLYSRALRDNKKLSGNIVLQLTILSSGQVGSCKIISNSMNDAEFVQKLLGRIHLINFGAGDFRIATVVKQFEFLPEDPH